MMKWYPKYSVGFKIIDEQHRKFFETYNKLNDAYLQGEAPEKLEAVLKELTEYTEQHFATEEKYFKEFQYEGAEEHIVQHDIFRAQVANFKKKFQESKDLSQLINEIIDLLDSWLIDHVIKMDHKYIDCFKEHGLI